MQKNRQQNFVRLAMIMIIDAVEQALFDKVWN